METTETQRENDMKPPAGTVNESTLRSKAKRKGYMLHKSRQLRSLDNLGGFMMMSLCTGYIVAGDRYYFSLEDVAAWLNGKASDPR